MAQQVPTRRTPREEEREQLGIPAGTLRQARGAALPPLLAIGLLGACEPTAPLHVESDAARVALRPSAITLLPGGTTQFVAVALTASGDTAPVPLYWSPLHGELHEEGPLLPGKRVGHYTAPQWGDDLIMVTDSGGHADTSTVIVLDTTTVGGTCLDQPGPRQTLVGLQARLNQRTGLADSTTIDGRQAMWVAAGDKPVYVGEGHTICFSGGVIQGDYPDDTTWQRMHDTYAFTAQGPGMIIEGIRVHNYGDGVSFDAEAHDWVVRSAHFSFIRDDCIQNDFLHAGLIDDVLFDGCYVGYSARTWGNLPEHVDRSGNVVTIQSSLIRLQPMPTVYDGPVPSHAAFFKLDPDGTSPRFALHNNIFRADTASALGNNSPHMTMVPPPEKIASCSNNIVVWLGPGDFPAPLPGCFTVTRDLGVWEAAVAAWLARRYRRGDE